MDFYKAYAAVHNSDIRKEINDVRDEISEMDFSLVSDAELISIAEEVLLEVFEEGYTVDDAEAIFEEVIAEAKVTYGHDTDGARRDKIDKLKTSMKSAMGKAKEKAARGAVKSYAAYRSAKSSAEMSARRAGQSIKNKTAVAQRKASDNKSGIKAGLKSMVKKAAQAVGKVGAEVKKGYDKGMKKESYLETDMEKRKKNNEKARKDMKKMGSMKNPHFGDGPTGSMSSEEVEMDEMVMGQDREMRKAASGERSKERVERGGAAPKTPGKEGPSAGKSYADYQKLSIAAHDKLTKKNKNVVGLVAKEEVENIEELHTGKHGQTEKQYQDSRSDAGKMVSGDSKMSGSKYAQGRRTGSDAGPQPAGGSQKPASQGKMDSGSRTDLTFRKAALKKKAAAKNEEFASELDERTRYAKETGKDPQTGNPSEKGGTIKPGSAMSKVRKSLAGQGLMSSRRKAIKPQGQKKEKGAKGYEGPTPVDKIKAMVQKKRAPKPNPYGYGQGRNMGD